MTRHFAVEVGPEHRLYDRVRIVAERLPKMSGEGVLELLVEAGLGPTEKRVAVSPRARKEMMLEEFAALVLRAARSQEAVRWLDSGKVFISSVWRQVRGDFGGRRDAFDRLLIAASQKGLLHLSRADLVGAMDAREVRDSEVRYSTSSFHFVVPS